MELPTPALLTLILWMSRVKGEIRCHCNDASCVATGYMCKSEVGRCFTLLSYDGEHSHSAHGCVDFLVKPDCESQGDVLQTRGGMQGWPIIMCCQADMCNYMNDVNINVDPNSKHNRTTLLTDSKGDHNYRWRTMDDNASPEKLWFKAAVIAVPIAGGFILIFLVLLAVRMLRSDTKRHRRLMEMRKHRSLTKAQLYVADHFIDKSDSLVHTNALEKQNHIYKNVNIKIDCDGTIYEKQKNTDICDRPGSVSSVIVWGGDKNKDSEPSNV